MQVFTSNRILSLCLVLAFLGCSCSATYRDFFFVKNDGVIMPVKVSGNQESNNYLILLPGGPAGDGLMYQKLFPIFKEQLEPKFKMVYYDQRGAGNAQGTFSNTALNLKQLGEDLTCIIQSIKLEHEEAKIFLLGYSFGGTLGTHYLLEPKQQQEISGLITISGTFDRVKQKERQEAFTIYLLDKWVEEGYIDNYDALKTNFTCDDANDVEACEKMRVETLEKVNKRMKVIDSYSRFPFNWKSLGRLLSYAFFSPSNPIYSGKAEGQNESYYQTEFSQYSMVTKAQKIKIPVLILQGRMDTNVPFFEAEEVFQNLGTPKDQKKIVLLEASGHIPMLTEPELLAQNIVEFVEKNSNTHD